ncbi:MAG: lipoyl(octanoyl) transferase LipB [Muribaculaceae bacterium]|nr:lipoyl(octanoyl) transferase LipB [Muribaculaceae bacterium]
MELTVIDEGQKDYGEMLEKQRSLFTEMVACKKSGQPVEKEYLFLVEHNPVVTLGKHAKETNVLLPEKMLGEKGVEVFHIERGGDVTYHGPGQLVAYPLLDLEAHHLGVKDYVHLLEESVILTIADFGIRGERVAGASGVWIGAGTTAERKICALGVKCSRYITMHGLALNVNTDLNGFSLINPCGFVDKGVTSMARELNRKIDMDKVKASLSSNFIKLV